MSDLDKHHILHTEEKFFMCELCNKRFFNKSILSRHYHVHTYESAFICHVCNKEFSHKPHLKAHMRYHIKAFSYDICKH